MKNTKRFLAMAAAMTLAACAAAPLSMTASAAGTGVITITDSSEATHNTLSAFQIFTADLDANKDLIVTGWGDGINVAGLSTAIKSDTDLSTAIGALTTTQDGAKAAAKKIADLSQSNAEKLARLIAQNTTGTGKAAEATSGDTTIKELENGYYIVVDTAAATKDNYTAYTLGMLAVVNGTTTTVSPKINFPSFDKQIGDINDSTDAANTFTFNEAADHDINDNVPFKLIATVPDNIDKYDTYKLIFHDNLQADVFNFNDDVTVKYYASSSDTTGTDVTTGFKTTKPVTANEKFSGTHGDKTEDFTVTFGNIKGIAGLSVAAGGRFEVSYTAKLTDKAKIGTPGNWNSAYLEYSNNPNKSGEGDTDNTGDSPEDSVVAFTYQAVVNKTDKEGNPLAGATFTLEKKLKDGTKATISVVKANDDKTFVFNGLDDGDYILTETEAPAGGYVAISPIEFTVTGTEVQTNGSEALQSVTASGSDFTASAVYEITESEGKKTAKAGLTAVGALKATIENDKGTNLPTTGGIGTTLFVLGGGCAAGLAGIYLISKKRAKDASAE